MKLNSNPEKTAGAWLLRALMGPAQIADGIVSTLTVGSLGFGFALKTARALASKRLNVVCMGSKQ